MKTATVIAFAAGSITLAACGKDAVVDDSDVDAGALDGKQKADFANKRSFTVVAGSASRG